MKSDLLDVSETKKSLTIEIPSDQVDAEIQRVVGMIGRTARIPGFRPGKVPASIIRTRFKADIADEVAHELVPRAVDEALRERGLEPVATPDLEGVDVKEGQPLSFKASFDVLPPVDPGDYAAIHLRRHSAVVTPESVDKALEGLRQRAARYEPVEDRGLAAGDTAMVDIERKQIRDDGTPGPAEKVENVPVEMGSQANPPGFDEALTGLRGGEEKAFRVHYPEDYTIKELASRDVDYAVKVRAVRRRVVPPLDDDLAKEVSNADTLEKLREQVQEGLAREVAREAEQELRSDLLKALAEKVTFPLPEVLVEHEMDRRTSDLVSHLIEQGIDPRKTGIDLAAFRAEQRPAAENSVRATIVLDEVARREDLAVSDEDLDRELAGYAERSGEPVDALRARLEKDGELEHLRTGMRRDRSVEFVLSRATIAAS